MAFLLNRKCFSIIPFIAFNVEDKRNEDRPINDDHHHFDNISFDWSLRFDKWLKEYERLDHRDRSIHIERESVQAGQGMHARDIQFHISIP